MQDHSNRRTQGFRATVPVWQSDRYASLHTCHVLRPQQVFKELAIIAPFVSASVTLKTSPPASLSLSGLNVLQGVRIPLWPICFYPAGTSPVYASSVLFDVTRSLDWWIRLYYWIASHCPLSIRDWCPTRAPGNYLRNRRNTRYGWLAKPYPARTFTRQEAPSFPWRTNALIV